MKKLDRVGEIYFSNSNERFKIIEYFLPTNVTIQFDDGTTVYNKNYGAIKLGKITNPNSLTVYNIGYVGIGKYLPKKYSIIYNSWHSMLQRCYCQKYQSTNKSYVGCSVEKNWLNFQVFAEWYEQNYIDKFHLDKDILIKGNKIYGPDTCCFVPEQINTLFLKSDKIRGDLPIGVSIKGKKYLVQLKKFGTVIYLGTFPTPERAFNIYKLNKEFYIQQMANIWKPKIPDKLYQAMINYRIEITD